ncbi:hypothetical protein Zm00014a_024916 [Zea mays]|uniref:Uncharacterized protein n=1 Tax=Zea mays TaxID=4577 RepID=A0A3L6EQU7_MAIZE|nr:hypothetical protein Zm00014a_024916 [Zea mays]
MGRDEGFGEKAKAVVKISSFQIILAQGVTGSFPWSALPFAPMWLELMGFTHNRTGLLMITFALASSLGGLLGGNMGDHFATCFPNSGRIVLSQISSASAIPLAALLLLGLPDNSSGSLHGLVMFIMGLSISWNGPATNKQVIDNGLLPILVKIVKKKTDLPVREKIFLLLDPTQTSLGGAKARLPQYYES